MRQAFAMVRAFGTIGFADLVVGDAGGTTVRRGRAGREVDAGGLAEMARCNQVARLGKPVPLAEECVAFYFDERELLEFAPMLRRAALINGAVDLTTEFADPLPPGQRVFALLEIKRDPLGTIVQQLFTTRFQAAILNPETLRDLEPWRSGPQALPAARAVVATASDVVIEQALDRLADGIYGVAVTDRQAEIGIAYQGAAFYLTHRLHLTWAWVATAERLWPGLAALGRRHWEHLIGGVLSYGPITREALCQRAERANWLVGGSYFPAHELALKYDAGGLADRLREAHAPDASRYNVAAYKVIKTRPKAHASRIEGELTMTEELTDDVTR